MYKNYSTQRTTYKLLEKLTSHSFKSEINFLKQLVKDIVDHDEFEITGGRIWEISPSDYSYNLKFQYGTISKIPEDYAISINDQPTMLKLFKEKTILNYETDALLQEKGIQIYSITGVGAVVKIKGSKFYQYALGFNAPEILQSFYETLNIISSVATISLSNMKNQAAQKKINRDLVKAAEIQRNLFPDHKNKFYDYDIYGICSPASEVGGDYFDYIKNTDVEDERLGIVVSDAASKGLPAAIQSLFVSGALRMGSRFGTKISHLLSYLNTLIWETFQYERIVTLFYLELTLSQNRLVLYANAGHWPGIHYRPGIDGFKFLDPTGGFLGLVEHQVFGVENLRMHPGDIIVLYTDGITEALNGEGEQYGENRLMTKIREFHKESSEIIALNILEDVQKFSAESDYNDDKTLVVVKRDEE